MIFCTESLLMPVLVVAAIAQLCLGAAFLIRLATTVSTVRWVAYAVSWWV